MTSCTSVVAVRTNSCVLIASEGRIGTTCYGRATSYRTSKSRALLRRVGMGFSGDLNLPRLVSRKMRKEYATKDDAVKTPYPDDVAKIVYDLTSEFVKNTDTMNSVIVAGSGKDGSYQMFLIETKERSKKRKMFKEVFCKESKEKYIAIGSGSKTIDKIMKQKNVHAMSDVDAIKLVMLAVKDAIGKDWGSGGRLEALLIKSNVAEFRVYHKSQAEDSYYLMDYSDEEPKEDLTDDSTEEDDSTEDSMEDSM